MDCSKQIVFDPKGNMMEDPIMVNPCSVCDSEKRKVWHLVCPGCWEVLPAEVRDELYAAYKEKPQSQRHFRAIRAAYSALFVGAKVSDIKAVLMEGSGKCAG